MAVCRIPSTIAYTNLAGALTDLALPFANLSASDPVTLDCSGLQFCDPAGTVALAAYGAHYLARTDHRIELVGWDPASYLSRVGFKRLCGYPDDWPKRRIVSDHLTSIERIRNAEERAAASVHVLDVLGITHEASRYVLIQLLDEILRNVEEHAWSPVNALLQAQFYPSRGITVFAVADTGVGIFENLQSRHADVVDDETALRKALNPGVSGRNLRRDHIDNAGVGLTVTSRLVRKARGVFQIASGDTVLEVTANGETARKLSGTRWPGVIVTMVVPRDDTLDWDAMYEEVTSNLPRGRR